MLIQNYKQIVGDNAEVLDLKSSLIRIAKIVLSLLTKNKGFGKVIMTMLFPSSRRRLRPLIIFQNPVMDIITLITAHLIKLLEKVMK
jgi:hypothetical protein